MELFVLQRCWFSGPHHEPSVDCLRLFTSRREAEEVGFHAAHEFANRSIFSTSRTSAAPVKTILLPPSALGAVSSSYAFQTCGKLFWVRSLKATIVPPAAISFGNTCAYTTAQVVLTQGIIGGTGNPNSRRGSEISEGRVFLGTDAKAVQTAVEVGRQVHFSMANNPNVKITVAALPIGKPQNGMVLDWPPSSSQHQQDSGPMTMVADPSNKREWTATTGAPTDNPNLSAKRHRQVSVEMMSS